MKKKTIRLTERYVRESTEAMQEAERIGLAPGLLIVEHAIYIPFIMNCIATSKANDPERELIILSGYHWPMTFIVQLENKTHAL